MPLRHIGLRIAAVLPVMLLVLVAGTVALLGLGFRDAGREYAQRVCQAALLAACALMAGRALDLSGVPTGSLGSADVQPVGAQSNLNMLQATSRPQVN
jgi:hypothetical protein